MNKKQVEKRLEDIEKAMMQAKANFNVLEGGKLECLYWLDLIDKESEK